MDKLIKALTIFRKYGNPEYPTHCEHDVLYINVDYNDVSPEDKLELEELGFIHDKENDKWKSYHFGSC